jgi:hypothetical protein
MKLALATLSIIRIGTVDRTSPRRSQPASNILLRSNSTRSRRVLRPSGELIARWHISPESGRIECRWLLDQPPADDHLCASPEGTKRRLRRSPRHSPLWRRAPIAGVTNLSINQ